MSKWRRIPRCATPSLCDGVRAVLLMSFIMLALAPARANADESRSRAGDDARATIESANGYYDQAEFSRAVDLATSLIERGDLSEGESIDAWELLAKCRLRVEDVSGARNAFAQILALDCMWAPDSIEFAPPDLGVFADVKAANPCPQEPPGRPWYSRPFGLPVNLVALGGAIGGVVFAVTRGGDDDVVPRSKLPDPPNPPTKDHWRSVRYTDVD